MTDPPYQRNIRYTFNSGASPWTPVYQGLDDNDLKGSDYVEHSDNWEWFASNGGFPEAEKHGGLIGIDNRQQQEAVTADVTFHIDNWDRDNEWKHVWEEMIFTQTSGSFWGQEVRLPNGFSSAGPRHVSQDVSGGYLLSNYAYKVLPNPPYEEIYFSFSVPAGGYLLIDEIHFATECVPEPATVTLAVLGGVLFAVRRRRRK